MTCIGRQLLLRTERCAALNTPAVGFNSVMTTTLGPGFRFTDSILRAGLTYHFGGPAVAHY